MPTDSSEGARLMRALPPLLDEIESTNKWMRDLDYELKEAATRRGHLIASADAMMRSLDRPGRERYMRRYTALCAQPTGRPRKRSRALKAVLEFLIDNQHDHVRASELTWYVRRCGYRASNRYGSNTLTELCRSGHVTKTGHGIYRINRHHPELLAIQLELLEKSHRRLMLT